MTEHTAQPGQPLVLPPVDPGNPFLAALAAIASGQPLDEQTATTVLEALGAATLTTARLDTPSGPRLVVTLRSAGATVTALLGNAGDARVWGEQLINDGTLHLSGLHLPGQPGQGLNGHQHPGGRG